MITGIFQSGAGNLHELLRSFQKEQDETLGAALAPEALSARTTEATAIQAASTDSASSNMMSRNFASAEREESKYITARKAGQEAASKQASRQMAILNAGLAELGSLSGNGADSYAIRNLVGRKAARRIMEEGQQAVREESEKNLKEMKEKIEEKTQDATTPKDESGRPVEGLPTEGAGEAAPMPEVSGSDSAPAPAPQVEAAPAPDVARATAPMTGAATPVAQTTPSINITV